MSLQSWILIMEGKARIGMCMGHRCIMSSRRKRRNETITRQNALVIVSMNSTEVVNGHRCLLSTISPPHSLLCLCFFLIFSYPPARIREVPVQCSTTLFFFSFLFAHCRQNKSFPPLFSFPSRPRVQSLHYPPILSRSLSCWPLADPKSRSPIPFFYHHHGRSLRSSVY